MKDQKILIIAGEASGNRHASDLVKALHSARPDLRFFGIGGDEMAETGVQLFYHIRDLAFLGFTEIIRHLPFIFSVFRKLRKWIEKEQPLAVILVDYPGFNLRFARMVKKTGIPVIYYICPQLWAWGARRVEKLRRYVSLPLVIFKFEEEYYAERGITAKFVGHPLVDQIRIELTEAEFRRKCRLDSEKPIIAILPGSRRHEIENLLPVVLRTIQQFKDENKFEWVIGKAGAIPESFYLALTKGHSRVRLISEIHPLMKYAHVALVASGTATLETGYSGTPMIVLYKVSPLTYFIGRRLVTIKNIALANIVCRETVVPELIQHEVTPENVLKNLNRYLENSDYYDDVRKRLGGIPELLGEPGAASRAAEEIVSFLKI